MNVSRRDGVRRRLACTGREVKAPLRVEQDQQGYWLAYREDYPLLENTKPARFATCADAQRAADAHELDLFPDANVIDDGYSWLPDPEIDWRSVPHLVEAHASRPRALIMCSTG